MKSHPVPKRRPHSIDLSGPSRTKQAPRDEVDINSIMRRYSATGLLPHLMKKEPRYGDFSSVGDYQSCLDRVREAQSAFDQLPSNVRAHFANDPGELVAAALDPARQEELRTLGLVPPGEEPTAKQQQLVAQAVAEGVKPPEAS